jgi:hypothetical protein
MRHVLALLALLFVAACADVVPQENAPAPAETAPDRQIPTQNTGPVESSHGLEDRPRIEENADEVRISGVNLGDPTRADRIIQRIRQPDKESNLEVEYDEEKGELRIRSKDGRDPWEVLRISRPERQFAEPRDRFGCAPMAFGGGMFGPWDVGIDVSP